MQHPARRRSKTDTNWNDRAPLAKCLVSRGMQQRAMMRIAIDKQQCLGIVCPQKICTLPQRSCPISSSRQPPFIFIRSYQAAQEWAIHPKDVCPKTESNALSEPILAVYG